MSNLREEFEKKVTIWAERFFFEAMDNPESVKYLFYHPSIDNLWGEFISSHDKYFSRPNWEFVGQIPRSLDFTAFRAWFRDNVNTLPILPTR